MQADEYPTEPDWRASALDPGAAAAEGARALDRQFAGFWSGVANQILAIALLPMGQQVQLPPRVALDRGEVAAAFHFDPFPTDDEQAVPGFRQSGAASTLPSRTVALATAGAAQLRTATGVLDHGRVPTRLLIALTTARSLPEVNAQPPVELFDELGL